MTVSCKPEDCFVSKLQNINIQAALPEQLVEIPRIELAAATRFAEADLPQNLRFRTTAMEDLHTALEKGQLWVAAVDDHSAYEVQVVGYAIADIVDASAFLAEIDVLPAFGRRGIGTRLVNRAADWARCAEFSSLTLITFLHLPWNAPFYARLGFDLVDPAKYGAEVSRLLSEEYDAGIDVTKRVVMRMNFDQSHSEKHQ